MSSPTFQQFNKKLALFKINYDKIINQIDKFAMVTHWFSEIISHIQLKSVWKAIKKR